MMVIKNITSFRKFELQQILAELGGKWPELEVKCRKKPVFFITKAIFVLQTQAKIDFPRTFE